MSNGPARGWTVGVRAAAMKRAGDWLTLDRMGFYYGSGEPPKQDPPPGSWRETFAIIIAVFKALALPLGILFGAILGLILLVLAFTISAWIGLAIIVAGVAVVAGYGVWEAKHPPKLP